MRGITVLVAAVVLADVKKGKGTYGQNAATGEYGGMHDMGGMGM